MGLSHEEAAPFVYIKNKINNEKCANTYYNRCLSDSRDSYLGECYKKCKKISL